MKAGGGAKQKNTPVETYWTRIPFDMGGKPAAIGGLGWQSTNTVWLRRHAAIALLGATPASRDSWAGNPPGRRGPRPVDLGRDGLA